MRGMPPRAYTIGHGTRSGDDLVGVLRDAGVRTLVDVRRYPGSRRNPQFNLEAVAKRVSAAGITYVHAVELGGRLRGEPGEDRFRCIASAAFRSYAARMGTPDWQAALADAVHRPVPCFMCAETLWWRCHRWLIAELLEARGFEVVHLIRRGEHLRHRISDESQIRDGKLYLCGQLVA
jgi:uncharacterized protein (DUF488 family)